MLNLKNLSLKICLTLTTRRILKNFFARPEFFDKLAGIDELGKQIIAGATEIREPWLNELNEY